MMSSCVPGMQEYHFGIQKSICIIRFLVHTINVTAVLQSTIIVSFISSDVEYRYKARLVTVFQFSITCVDNQFNELYN